MIFLHEWNERNLTEKQSGPIADLVNPKGAHFIRNMSFDVLIDVGDGAEALASTLLIHIELFTLGSKSKRCCATYVSSCTSMEVNILPLIIPLMPYTRLL